ncbi:MAG: LysR family transcriptional regulator, partial [Candidatus Accumulibacter sp.]|nr:LysR family transcriptional regulator [Accumulibacter sp.]
PAGKFVHLPPEWNPSFPRLCLHDPANRHPPVSLRSGVDLETWRLPRTAGLPRPE